MQYNTADTDCAIGERNCSEWIVAGIGKTANRQEQAGDPSLAHSIW